MSDLAITRERPDTADAAALIDALETVLSPNYAPESRHGYSIDKLIKEGVHFFVARVDGRRAACGGIQFHADFGELKRMYVCDAFRGRGIGYAMLEHLAAHARAQDCAVLRLETGIHQHAAIKLYERCGFRRIGPFPPYKADPVSIFFEKRL